MSTSSQFIWNILQFPDAAHLHRRVPKKQFVENGSLSAKDKLFFKECIDSIYWEYTLKPSTCPVLPFKDKEREYLEIAILSIELTSPKKHKHLAEIIHKAIPYPLFIVFRSGSEFALSIAPKRFNQAEQGAYVVEKVVTTGFITTKDPLTYETDFLSSLTWCNLPLTTYGSVYTAWAERFAAYNCALLSNSFSLNNPELKEKTLARCKELKSQLATLRSEMKKAEFNRKVELNVEIKKIEKELQLATASLT